MREQNATSKTLLVIILLLLDVPSEARTNGLHNLSIGLGAPIPLTVFGFSGDPEKGEYSFLFAGNLDYRVRVATRPLVDVGVSMAVGGIWARERDAKGHLVSFIGGPPLTLGVRAWSISGFLGTIFISLAPIVGLMNLYVDENIGFFAVTLGGQAAIRIEQQFKPGWSVWIGLAFDWLSEPLNRETYFNQSLGQSRLLFLSIGTNYEWGKF